MTKADLVKKLALNAGITQSQANDVLRELAQLLVEDVQKSGNSVAIPQLGTFKQIKTNPRTGRNPKTGELIDIPAGVKIGFKMSASLK